MGYRWLVALLVLGGAVIGPVRADAIVRVRAMTATTIAEYFIDETGVRVELEIGGADLPAFRNLLPDSAYDKLGLEPRPLADRLPEFFAADLPVATLEREPLPGQVRSIEVRDRVRRDDITGEPLPPVGEPEKVVFAELFYPFDRRPAGLLLSGPSGGLSASVGFVVYHRGLPVNDFRYLGQQYELALDWDDPWYSRFGSRNLRRAYDAAMTGFIYVEPYEVRKEIIARPRDLQRWVDLGLEGQEVIPAERQPDLLRRIGEFLRQRHPVSIDGATIEPELARVNFLRRTLRNSTVIDPPEDLDAISATVGAIFVYPTDGLPDHVTMEWDLFDPRVDRVPVASVDQAGPLPGFVWREDPVLVWRNFLQDPDLPTMIATALPPGPVSRLASRMRWVFLATAVVAALIAIVRLRRDRRLSRPLSFAAVASAALAVGAFWTGNDARMTESRMEELVAALLHNVYRAFDFRDEERIYDVLAQSVAGDLLTDIYLETRRGLEIRNQGGARAKVKELALVGLDTGSGENGGFTATAVWDVAGSVGHWGHVHRRTNRYRADLGIEPVDGTWKLTSLELLDEQRLDAPSGG